MDFSTTPHLHRQVSPSTNSELSELIKTGAINHNTPQLMTADSQTAGRGQHSRSWVSPIGNVYLSLYVPMHSENPHGLHRLTGALSLCVGLSLWQMNSLQSLNAQLKTSNLPSIQLKWANDLGFYQHNSIFCKLAGILIEPVIKDKLLGVIIGVGLNVNNSPVIADGLYQAISLKALIDNHSLHYPSNLKPQEFYQEMTNAIFDAITCHNSYTKNHNHGIVFDKTFIEKFNSAHALTHKKVAIFEQDNTTTPAHIGTCLGIHTDGTLILQHNHEIQYVFSGMAKLVL